MRRSGLAMIVVALAAAGQAQAKGTPKGGSLSVSGSIAVNGFGNVTESDPLKQFDPSLGQLTGVTAVVSGSRTTYYTSYAFLPLDVAASTAVATITFGSGAALMHGTGTHTTAQPLTPFDYTLSSPGETVTIPTSEWAGLIGTGSVDIQGFLPSAVIPNASALYHSGSASTAVTLLYSYAPRINPAVPEPATWATMITGFGLVGAAARRARRRRAAIG